MTSEASCRLCGAPLTHTFVDLGSSPPCESYLSAAELELPERFYPLHVRICGVCLLVQLPAYIAPQDIFSDYAYFSSYSDSWVAHAEKFCIDMIDRLGLTADSLVVEVASNDGYLLQHMVSRGVRALGVEPADNVARVARQRAVPTEAAFFSQEIGRRVRRDHGPARLVVANNVLAHVPDPVDLAAGMREVIADDGIVSLEFPHLLRLIEGRQYDTIYHEHYSYFTLRTAGLVLERAGLQVIDVAELPTHGGSLRVFARPAEYADSPSRRVASVLEAEAVARLDTLIGHAGFADAVLDVKTDFLDFLIRCRRESRTVAGYGAPGKGNTLLNHCGVRADLLPYTVDRSPHKQGKYLPGTRIPIRNPDALIADAPDFVVILPWNLRNEISHQLASLRSGGTRFVVPVPELSIF